MKSVTGSSGGRRWRQTTGFTLMELMIAVAIVGILAAIAYPAYNKSVTKTKRRAAEACLSNYATYMERFYTTNLSYAEDTSGNAISLPTLDCASAQNTGSNYQYSLSTTTAVTQSTYLLQAVPTGTQSTADASCGTLTLDQTGARNVTGSDGAAACW